MWALTYVVGLANPDAFNPVRLVDYVAVVQFSAMLAVLAPAAWLIARMAGSGRAVLWAAAITAAGGLVAAIGNVIEDGLGAKGIGSPILVLGLGGLLLGLIALAVALAIGRRTWLVALTLVTFVGLFSSANGGAFLIPIAWFGLAVWMWRRPRPEH